MPKLISKTKSQLIPAGFQLNRRGFMVLASASVAALALPKVVFAHSFGFNISLAGDLRAAFEVLLDYDTGNSLQHVSYQGEVRISNKTYQIVIDTQRCSRTGMCRKLIPTEKTLYLQDLIDVANTVPDSSVLIKELSV